MLLWPLLWLPAAAAYGWCRCCCSSRHRSTCTALNRPHGPLPLQSGDKIEVFEIVKKSLKLEEAKAATADMQQQPADADA